MVSYYVQLLLIKLPQLSLQVSHNVLHAVFLYSKLVLFLAYKKIFRGKQSWQFTLQYQGKNISMRLFEGSPEIAALIEIYVEKEYEFELYKPPQIIIDLGAHTGNTALYFHARYPKAIIYAIEASPQNYVQLVKNVADISAIVPWHGAITDTDGHIEFFESKNSLGSSLQKRSNDAKVIEVPSFTLKTLFSHFNIECADLLKVDIEGGEEKLFPDSSPEAYAHAYAMEVHGDLMERTIASYVEQFSSFSKVRTVPVSKKDRVLLYAENILSQDVPK